MCNSEERACVALKLPLSRDKGLPSESCHSTYSAKRKGSQKKDVTRSFARQFLDLTLDEPQKDHDLRKLFNKGLSFGIKKGINKASHSSVATDDTSYNTCSDGSICIEDHFEPEDLEGWERSDALFIDEVHGISKELEERMIQRGIKSPFKNAHELFPRFQRLHSLVQADISEQGKLRKQATTEDFLSGAQTFNHENGELDDFLYQNQMPSSVEESRLLPIRPMVKPGVLVPGLDRELPMEAMKIMEELTSPLRKWR